MNEPTKYGEGFHDMPELNYHADPAPEPSLSSSVAKIIWTKTPLHAKHAHPRFHPEALGEDKPTRPKEIGTVGHKLILGRGRDFKVIGDDDYRSKASQEMRRVVYENGFTPILKPDLDKAHAIAEAAMKAIVGTELERFGLDGQSEATALWREGPIWCRSRLDWLPDGTNHLTIVDVKTVTTGAGPLEWGSSMADLDAAIQAAFYERGVIKLRKPKSARVVFLVVEQDPPYAVGLYRPSGEAMAKAHDAVQATMDIWAQCLRTGEWPAYPKEIQNIDEPAWSRVKGELRALGYKHLLEVMGRWQGPLEGPKP